MPARGGTRQDTSPVHPRAGDALAPMCCVTPSRQLQGLPCPGGSSWDLTCTHVLEGFSPREEWQQGRRKSLVPSPRQQGAGMRQMSGFGGSVASGDGERAGNHSWSQGVGRGQGAQPCRHRQAQGPAHARAPPALPSQQQINGYEQTPASAHTQSGFVKRVLARHPWAAFPMMPKHSSVQSPSTAGSSSGRAVISPASIQLPGAAEHRALGRLEPGHRETALGTGARLIKHLLQPQASLSPLEGARERKAGRTAG